MHLENTIQRDIFYPIDTHCMFNTEKDIRIILRTPYSIYSGCPLKPKI